MYTIAMYIRISIYHVNVKTKQSPFCRTKCMREHFVLKIEKKTRSDAFLAGKLINYRRQFYC